MTPQYKQSTIISLMYWLIQGPISFKHFPDFSEKLVLYKSYDSFSFEMVNNIQKCIGYSSEHINVQKILSANFLQSLKAFTFTMLKAEYSNSVTFKCTCFCNAMSDLITSKDFQQYILLYTVRNSLTSLIASHFVG